MNMFRNLLTLTLFGLAIALTYGQPENWTWPDLGGTYVVQAVGFLISTRPFCQVIMIVLGIALFMTRKQY